MRSTHTVARALTATLACAAAAALIAPPAAFASAPPTPDADRLSRVVSGKAARDQVAAREGRAPRQAAPPGTPTWRVDGSKRRSKSVGKPNRGRLVGGTQLPAKGPGFHRRTRDRSHGTDETIAMVQYAGAMLVAAFPGTEPMIVGDISQEGGGRLRPHSSHRSGRDIDIGYFEQGNPERRHFRRDLPAADMDTEKTWFLLDTLIATGQVKFVFVHEDFLAPLHAAAEAAGWTEDALTKLFLMPGQRKGHQIIRGDRVHRSHFHVRFVCPDGDKKCED